MKLGRTLSCLAGILGADPLYSQFSFTVFLFLQRTQNFFPPPANSDYMCVYVFFKDKNSYFEHFTLHSPLRPSLTSPSSCLMINLVSCTRSWVKLWQRFENLLLSHFRLLSPPPHLRSPTILIFPLS